MTCGQVEMLEAFTGFETANMYHILGPGGPIMVAAEQSECCERQCCGSVRSFTMQLAMLGPQGQSNGMPVISYVRPLRCKPVRAASSVIACVGARQLLLEGAGGRGGGG
eukprot:COSAG01_NODE_21933_length_878_cov_5.530167_1_plen_108_part_10